MFPSDMNNAFAYEVERRKDEMRDAATSNWERKNSKKRRPRVLPMAILSTIIRMLTIFIGH